MPSDPADLRRNARRLLKQSGWSHLLTRRNALYLAALATGVLQFVFLYVFLSGGDDADRAPMAGGGRGGVVTKGGPASGGDVGGGGAVPGMETRPHKRVSSGGGKKGKDGDDTDGDLQDFWEKHFKERPHVEWKEFSVLMLMEHAADVRNLTASLAPSVAGHFDVNDDGIVSRKEYNRFLRKYGIEGMRQGLQSAVDASLDNFWRRDIQDRRRTDLTGCALGLEAKHNNHVELEASADLSFNGAKPFCIEVWLRPDAKPREVKDDTFRFGGNVFSKYNRGRRGQYFFSVEETGHIFFHREVAPWGLRSQTKIQAGAWTHVAVTFGAGRSKIYVNGTLRGSQREGAMAQDALTSVLVGAIHDQDQPASAFNGQLDELRLWNVDRSQTEIEKNMHQTLTGLEYGLVGYWQFDECAGGRARDRLGKHDGVLNGGGCRGE